MKKIKTVLLFFLAGVTVVAICICAFVFGIGIYAYVLMSDGPVNDLGLSKSDLEMGEDPNVEDLRTRTKTVADAYLVRRQADLTQVCGGRYELYLDYSLVPKLRSLGYRSSFYYYCWDIYLPYLLKSKSGKTYLVVVQISDGKRPNTHDPDKFWVVRSMVIDGNGVIKQEFEK